MRFATGWLAVRDKVVAPLPLSGDVTSTAAAYVDACRRAGYSTVLAIRTGGEDTRAVELRLGESRLPAPMDAPSWSAALSEPCLLTPPDSDSALLLTGQGYGLLAGARDFLALALPHSPEAARVDFARYARRVRAHRDAVVAVVAEFPGGPVSARVPADLDPATGAGDQIDLMRKFSAGRLEGHAFLVQWMAARHASLAAGERLGGALADVLNDTFFALEHYEVAPELAEPGDLTEAELRDAVGEALRRIDHP